MPLLQPEFRVPYIGTTQVRLSHSRTMINRKAVRRDWSGGNREVCLNGGYMDLALLGLECLNALLSPMEHGRHFCCAVPTDRRSSALSKDARTYR